MKLCSASPLINAPSVSDYGVNVGPDCPGHPTFGLSPEKKPHALSPETDEFATGSGIRHLRAPGFRRNYFHFRGRAAHSWLNRRKWPTKAARKAERASIA